MSKEPQSLTRLLDWVEKLPIPLALTTGLLLAGAIGWIDALTGFDISLSFFYLIPIAMATWAGGDRAGLAMSSACAAISLAVSLLTGLDQTTGMVILWNIAVRFAIFLSVTLLLYTLREHLKVERGLARTDFLTGALNNRAFYQVIKSELERARRYQRPLSIAYIDLDNFKEINDEFGHSIGDAVLRTVAKTILANIRAVDVLARIGGDEFAVLLPETGLEAEDMLKRLHRVITEELEKGSWYTTVSMGATTFLSYPRDVDEILRMADRTMYKVKRTSKNDMKFSVYEEEPEA